MALRLPLQIKIELSHKNTCIIVGASHAGVNAAFALRREGWLGDIIVYDKDLETPYHRPPLSKSFLTSENTVDQHFLMSPESYAKENISLILGVTVIRINRNEKSITLSDGIAQSYDKLILATGASPLVPSIDGIGDSNRVFYMRTANDAIRIRKACQSSNSNHVVIIGGGYIGLETAASLTKLGAIVTLVERDVRLLSRVTTPEMSDFFLKLHTENGVHIALNKNVYTIESHESHDSVTCEDGSHYQADVIVVGVGVSVNTSLAKEAGLKIENGIVVDDKLRTTDEDIYAIGDCTYHYNPHYNQFLRLESVQNAVDQAKICAKHICGGNSSYDTIPWFWSDQYDIKLQIVGLSTGYDQALIRKEDSDELSFSVWYFRGAELLAVDAVNSPKAYVLGSKFIKARKSINKAMLQDVDTPLHPSTLIQSE